MNKTENSDEKLINLYLRGDEGALDILIERYFKQVYNFLRRYIGDAKEAEDLTQEVFLRVWKNIKKFDPRRSFFRNRTAGSRPIFRIWLFRIARNAGIDYFRRKKIPVFSAFDQDGEEENLADKIADDAESIMEKISKRELAREMADYLAKLSELNRSALLLHYNQEMTFQEIADLSGESLNTVKSRHRRALVLLRKIINEKKEHQK